MTFVSNLSLPKSWSFLGAFVSLCCMALVAFLHTFQRRGLSYVGPSGLSYAARLSSAEAFSPFCTHSALGRAQSFKSPFVQTARSPSCPSPYAVYRLPAKWLPFPKR